MARAHHRIVLVTCLASGTFGCSWLLGVSEDPVVVDPAADSSTALETGRDTSTPDTRDAAVDRAGDAPEDAPEEAEED